MSASRPLRSHQRALQALVAAIARGEATGVSDILAAVTPGGGKSLLPVIAAAELIAAGRIDRVVWVVPRDSLRLQAEEAFADPAWRASLGHAVSVRAADNEPDPARGLGGYVTTYQAVAAAHFVEEPLGQIAMPQVRDKSAHGYSEEVRLLKKKP